MCQHRDKFTLYTVAGQLHVAHSSIVLHHGKSQKETTSEDVETQTPQAPQGEPPQEAHVAEVVCCENFDRFICNPPVNNLRVFRWPNVLGRIVKQWETIGAKWLFDGFRLVSHGLSPYPNSPANDFYLVF